MRLEGSRDPRRDDGKDGDIWLNTRTCDVFNKREGTWRFLTSIRGKRGERGFAGPPGPAGARGRDGSDDGPTIFVSDEDPPEDDDGVVGKRIFVGSGDPNDL